MPEEKKRKRTKSAAQLEKEWQEQQRKAQEKKQAFEKAKKEEAQKAKDWRTNAGMQVAGFVWKELGLEWDCFDMAKFEEQFSKVSKLSYSEGNPVFACSAEKVTAGEARKRWQQHAASKRPAPKKKTLEKKEERTEEMQDSTKPDKVYAKPWDWDGTEFELFLCPACGHKNRLNRGEQFKICSKCATLVMMDRAQE